MEGIKTRLQEIISKSTKAKAAVKDLEGELKSVMFKINGALVAPNYRGTSPEKDEIKRLVAQAEAINPQQTLTELEPLTKGGKRIGGNAEEMLKKKREVKEEIANNAVADDEDPKPHPVPAPKGGRTRKTKKSMRKTRKSRKYSRRQ